MIVELFFLTLFTNHFIIVHSAEYSAPLQFTQEPSDVQFSSKTSAYLHCVAMATSSYASNNQITITWRFENGSLVRNISDIVQTLPNGTLWFKPFNRLVPAVHRTKYQCVANLTLHNQAILSRLALVHGVIVKPFQVKVRDEEVYGAGGTASFTCLYPAEVSSYVQIRKWFADKQPKQAEPSGNLVIHDVQRVHSNKLYYCVVVNVLTKETLASNVAKIFIRNASDARKFPLKFNIVPVNKTVVLGNVVMFECLASRTRNVEYFWKHNTNDIKLNHRYSLVNGRSLRIMNTVLKDNGKYTCVVRDKISGKEISTSSYLLVQVRLVFRARPSKICTPYYVNATFPCEVTGYPQPKISWYKNAREITNNNKALRKGNSLIITSAWGKDEGIYQCIVSNGLETIHQAASLIVGAQAPRIIESFVAKNLSLYAKLDISCKATGKQQATLFWYRDGIRIEESYDHRIHLKHYHDLWTLQIRNVTSADSGLYRCEAMNRAGSNFSEAKILVKGPAKVTYVPKSVRGLLGKDVTITCKANGFPRAKITWYDNNGYLAPYDYRQKVATNDGESTLTIKGLVTSDKGRYRCTASSEIGPTDDASVDLTVYGAPEEKYKLEVVDEGSKKTFVCHECIKWTKNGKIVQNSARTTVTNVLQICILNLVAILESDAGNYTCHRQTTTGVHKDTKEIFVISRPRFVNPRSPNSTNVLEHGDVRITCHGAGFPTPRTIWRRKVGGSFDEVKDLPRFRVTTNGSLTILNAKAEDETDYSCEIRNSHSYRADLTIKLNVNVPARIVNWVATAFGDAGNMTKLNCDASGDETLNFTWFKNGQKISRNSNIRIELIPKLSKSTLTIVSTTGNDGGNYTCKVFNLFGKDEKIMRLEIRDRPDPPDLKKYYTKTKTSITVSWKPSFDGNSPILSYQIDYKTSAHPSTPVTILITAQNTSYKITELEPYTGYEVRVRARNALGMSDFSIETNVETAEDAPSAAPHVTVTPVEHSLNKQSLRIKWQLLDVKDANGVVKGYDIWFKKNSSDSFFTNKRVVTPRDGKQTTISYLKPYTYYKIKIQAFTSAGHGPNSSSIITRTNEGVPSTPPGNIRVTAKTSTSISLSWTAPSKDSTNGVLIGYRVHYDDNRKLIKMNANVDTSSDKTNLTLNDLGKYTNYAIKIAARTVRGPGLFSKLISVVTDEDIPGPPKNLMAVTTSVRSIKLTWSKPDEPNGRITDYYIYYFGNINKINTYHAEGTGTSHEFENLTENRTYYFKICAKTSKGAGNYTDFVMASTSKGPPSFIGSHSEDVTERWKKTVTLICRFSGFPIPTITWLDSKEKALNFGDAKYHVTIQGHLVIHDLRREDSKRYVCRVTNKWGTIEKGITLKVQDPPDPPKSIRFIGINSTAVKISWLNGFDGNSIITGFLLKYQRHIDSEWKELRLPGDLTEFMMNNVESERKYSFMMKASNEIGDGNFSEARNIKFVGDGVILNPIEEGDIEDEIKTKSSHKTIFKDSTVLGTLIGVCLFIIIVIVILALLTKLGYSPGSKLAQRSVEVWRWFVAKGLSATDHRRSTKRRSGGSSTDGHLGGSSSSLSQERASNNGSTFSLPRSSSRVTESGYATSVFPIPLPFGNYTPGNNGGVRASGSSDEGIGPETRSEIRVDSGDHEYRQPSIPPRSSNGTPAPLTLIMSSREYIDPEGVEQETSPLKRQRNQQDKMAEEMKENESEDISPDISPRGKERIYFQSLGHCLPINMTPGRPKYEDAHFIIGPDVDRILAYRPPRCYDSTSSEYSSSRDELAQAYEFGKLHHLDDFYGRPTLESASSSGETAGSDKDGICHFTSELSVGRPFLIPVAILPPPPNQRLRTRDRKRNPQGAPLNTYYEKDETLV